MIELVMIFSIATITVLFLFLYNRKLTQQEHPMRKIIDDANKYGKVVNGKLQYRGYEITNHSIGLSDEAVKLALEKIKEDGALDCVKIQKKKN